MSFKLSKIQSAVAAIALFATMMALQAAAQGYTVGAGGASFGNVASGASGDTEFTISASGGVTRACTAPSAWDAAGRPVAWCWLEDS